ncbi:hypothetical protein TU94_24960 [Streptomyces cyaneogriseus subsp. noncyanogenus]|uniref:Uncharacterized protein n=1 Tax=Streptomyces cyaneogriseus subsp. noncyanogenus TaxID=477245 RepID=A0A0C5G2M5_9ACTN|nr:hypothetical protein TU94_24960 [Streptomyces cyaneogriseus subsp. noncyanogenus]
MWWETAGAAIVKEVSPIINQRPTRQTLHHLVLMPDQQDRVHIWKLDHTTISAMKRIRGEQS